ncbi:MAG: HNH endonuclease, partial [Oscillospiraceae bacterium]|nr:HNH endonuclease [Oscillospiraceae bacterium]
LKCFFDKKGLLDYLYSVEFEYKNPSQDYRNEIKNSWQNYVDELQNYDDVIHFNVFRNNDDRNKNITSRFYIKSTDKIYDFFRRIAIPNMSSVLIQKVLVNSEVQLWFRLYLNDVGNEFDREIADESIEQIENDTTIKETEKQQIIKARIGQGEYRTSIIEKFKKCVITGVDDERVLIASHIKPWISSNNQERISQENGLLLSPTFDKLFDRGFISFRDSGVIMLSNHFSDGNFRLLGLSVGDKFNIHYSEKMKLFLDFHRDTIFTK